MGALVVAVIVAGIFLYALVIGTINGPGATQSEATQDSMLTSGDDALSLQEDLEVLSEDPTTTDEIRMDASF